MAEDRDDDMETAALDWVIRLRDPGFDGWEDFEAWLAADPAHADLYQRLAVADADMDDLLAAPPAPKPVVAPVALPPRAPRTLTRRTWLGGALAASLVAMIGFAVVDHQPALYQIQTEPGVRKTVTLADGTRIVMNGGTQLTLDRKDARHATLDRGEALFDVVHDEKAPFKVAVGDATLVDVGTAFNVLREGKVTAVQVAEGAVMYNPDSDAVRLDAGHSLRAVDGDSQLALGTVSPGAVAGWNQGRLIYDGQPMAEVAADLARWSGEPVRIDPAVAGQRFRGVLSLGEDRNLAHLAPLLDLDVRKSGREWILSSKRP